MKLNVSVGGGRKRLEDLQDGLACSDLLTDEVVSEQLTRSVFNFPSCLSDCYTDGQERSNSLHCASVLVTFWTIYVTLYGHHMPLCIILNRFNPCIVDYSGNCLL